MWAGGLGAGGGTPGDAGLSSFTTWVQIPALPLTDQELWEHGVIPMPAGLKLKAEAARSG